MPCGIYKRTETHKRHLSENHRNHQTEETKQKISENNAKFWLDKPFSEEHKQHLSENHADFRGEKSPRWKGGEEAWKKRMQEKRRGFGFIPLNDKFQDSDAHHLDKDFVLYLPRELHQSVRHNIFTGEGMEEINNLACEYVYGIKMEE